MNGAFTVGYNHEYNLYVKHGEDAVNYIDNTKKFHFPLRFNSCNSVGTFELCFDRPSKFIYKSYSAKGCDCFFIRKQNWQIISTELGQLFEQLFQITKIKKESIKIIAKHDQMVQTDKKQNAPQKSVVSLEI